jgi:hypothetical protein
VCTTQGVESHYGSNTTVGQSLAEADAIFSDPGRSNASCHHGKQITEEINTGRALEMNSLRLGKVAGGGTTLSWTPPYVADGEQVRSYNVWRRAHGTGPFIKIATTSVLSYSDASPGNSDYEVTAVRRN